MSLLEIILAVAAGVGIYVAVGQGALGAARHPRDRVAIGLAVAAAATAVACLAVMVSVELTDPVQYVAVMRWVYFPCTVTWLAATLWTVAWFLGWVPRRVLAVLTAALAAMAVVSPWPKWTC